MPPKKQLMDKHNTSVGRIRETSASTGDSPRVRELREEMSDFRKQWSVDLDEVLSKVSDLIELKLESNTRGTSSDLSDLTLIKREICEYVDTISVKIQVVWKERMDMFEERLAKMERTMEYMENEIERQEQYSRRSCLILHNVPESDSENPIRVAVDLLNDKLKCNLMATDIVVAHRLGVHRHMLSTDAEVLRPRPLIVKFIRMTQRNYAYYNKKLLKGTKYVITENLTKTRKSFYDSIRNKGLTCWTVAGDIHVLDNTGRKRILRSIIDFNSYERN